MNSIPPNADNPRHRRKRERLERHARDLRELGALGMELARLTYNQTFIAAAEPGTIGEISLAFARVSRAVRQTFALEAQIEDELDELDNPEADKSPESSELPSDQPSATPEPAQTDTAPKATQPAPQRARAGGYLAVEREAPEDLLGDLDESLDTDSVKIAGNSDARDAIEHVRRNLYYAATGVTDPGLIWRKGKPSLASIGPENAGLTYETAFASPTFTGGQNTLPAGWISGRSRGRPNQRHHWITPLRSNDGCLP